MRSPYSPLSPKRRPMSAVATAEPYWSTDSPSELTGVLPARLVTKLTTPDGEVKP